MEHAIEDVAAHLRRASSALVITGAALSAESGLTHFRGIPGLVRKDASDGKRFDAGLALETFRQRPAVTWKYLLEIDRAVAAAQPNRGHDVLVAWSRAMRLTIMTVNVDRLHQRAGSRDVIEMHGALHDLRCARCDLSTRHASYAALPMPPRCAMCGDVLRPDMPLFGETLPADPFTRLQAELDRGFEIVIAVGVNTMFPYLARPVLLAKQAGIPTVEIGHAQTDVTELVDIGLRGSPTKMLDLLASAHARRG